MKIKFFIFLFVAFGIALINGCGITGNSVKELKGLEEFNGKEVTVYKSLSCGCCTNYVNYLKKIGFNVNVIDMQYLNSIKEKYSIPTSMESCHTTIIGDYFIEGHVPVEAINKLLTEKPDVKGIALPGMPSASPGMPGVKISPFRIFSVSSDGNVQEFLEI